jgi:hypothetical protein
VTAKEIEAFVRRHTVDLAFPNAGGGYSTAKVIPAETARVMLTTHASQQAAVVAGLVDYLEAQDALDNREAAGINAEDYFVLLRRRNFARDCLDRALAAASEHAMKEQP